MYSPEVNELLRDRDVDLETVPDRFEVTGRQAEVAPTKLVQAWNQEGDLWNQEKPRLQTDLTVEFLEKKHARAKIGRTTYYQSLFSNELVTNNIIRKGDKGSSPYLSGPDLLLEDGRIRRLDDPLVFSNHIGVSSIAITQDGYLVILAQGEGNFVDPGDLKPSGSGSAEVTRLSDAETLQEFIEREAERELREECGLGDRRDGVDVRTRTLGFARLLHRGGKPEFLAVSHIDAPFEEINVPPLEERYVDFHVPKEVQCLSRPDLPETPENVISAIKKLKNQLLEPKGEASEQLILSFRFLEDWISVDGPDAIGFLEEGRTSGNGGQ